MGNIFSNWFQWGKTPNQNDPRNRRTEQSRDPWPPAKSEAHSNVPKSASYKDPPTTGSYTGRHEHAGPVDEPKETPPPPPPPPVTDTRSDIPPQEDAKVIPSISVLPKEAKPVENQPEATHQTEIQPQHEKTKEAVIEPEVLQRQDVKAQSDTQIKIISTDVEQQRTEDITANTQDELSQDDVSPQVEGAVVKIQAGIRGYLTRKALKENATPERSTGLPDEEKTPEPELVSEIEPIDSDAGFVENGEEGTMDEAATRIQASFRGYKTRQELKEKHGLDGPALRGSCKSDSEAVCSPQGKSTSDNHVETRATTLDVKEVVQYGSSSEIQENLESRVTPSIPVSTLTEAKTTGEGTQSKAQIERVEPEVKSTPPEIPKTTDSEPQQHKSSAPETQQLSQSVPVSNTSSQPAAPIAVNPPQVVSPPASQLREPSETEGIIFQAATIPTPQASPASIADSAVRPQAVVISSTPPVQAPDDEYEYEEYTDEEEEEEEDEEIKITNTSPQIPPIPPQQVRTQPSGQVQGQPASIPTTEATTRQTPAQSGQTTTQATNPTPDRNAMWVTSSVYQSAGQNEDGEEEEEEYEEEEEEEEEVELENGPELANAVSGGAAPQQPARPVGPEPRAPASNRGGETGQ